MKKLQKLSLLLILMVLLFASGCKKDNQRKPDDPVKEIKKSTNVFEVDKQTDQKITEFKEDKIVFNGNTTQLDSIKVGSVMMSGITENAPEGYLRKVTGIEKNGSEYVFTTQPAALTEAFENLEIDYTYSFSKSDSSKRTQAFEVSVPLSNIILYDKDGNNSTVYDQIKFNGNIVLRPNTFTDVDIDFKIKIWNSKLEYALIGTTLGFETDLSTVFGGELAGFNKSVKLFEQIMAVVPIPGTPLAITPTISVNLGASGSISSQLSYLQSSTGKASAWLEYKNGEWKTGSSKDINTESSFSGFLGNASLKTYLSPAINMKFNGQDWAKASVTASAYASLTAQSSPYKPCNLKVGVSGGAEANLAFFDKQFARASYPDIFDFSKSIYTCSSTPPVNTNPYLNPNLTYGSVTDIDGNKYATIQIGYQTWMAENLRTTKYNDGTAIPNVTDNAAWGKLTTGAYSIYNFSPENEQIYGKIYNWYAVNTGKLCPKGWHIPTDAEWTQLETYLGSNAGLKMKSIGNSTDGTGLWRKYTNTEGTNTSGFSGLPGGGRNGDGTYASMGSLGFWWSSTEYNTYGAWYRSLSYSSSNVNRYYSGKKSGFSCRCARD